MRVVNTINPLLRLNHYAAILWYVCSVSLHVLLALLDRYCSIQIITGVYLQALLVGVDVELNASAVRSHGKDANVVRFRRRVTWTVQNKSVVIARATGSTAIDSLQNIPTYLLGRGEVEPSTIHCANGPRRDL